MDTRITPYRFNSYYNSLPEKNGQRNSFGNSALSVQRVAGKSVSVILDRPVASESATGLLDYMGKIVARVQARAAERSERINHIEGHQIDWALFERRAFGRNTWDAFTHDEDKLIGARGWVSTPTMKKYHLAHSSHHTTNDKPKNIRSMYVDNMVSGPTFKPEKKMEFADFLDISTDLQKETGLVIMAKSRKFDKQIDLNEIRREREEIMSSPVKKAAFWARTLVNIVTGL